MKAGHRLSGDTVSSTHGRQPSAIAAKPTSDPLCGAACASATHQTSPKQSGAVDVPRPDTVCTLGPDDPKSEVQPPPTPQAQPPKALPIIAQKISTLWPPQAWQGVPASIPGPSTGYPQASAPKTGTTWRAVRWLWLEPPGHRLCRAPCGCGQTSVSLPNPPILVTSKAAMG